jgi:hypothetical protein
LDYDPNTMHLGYNPLKNRFHHKAWHPMWAGTLLGIGSTMGYIAMRSTMGSSSGFWAIPGLAMRLVPALQVLDPNDKYTDFYQHALSHPLTVNGLYRAALLLFIPVGSIYRPSNPKQLDCLADR